MSEADRYAKATIPASHPYHGIVRFLSPGMTVLDVGCGSGDAAQFLADTGATFDGIEMNPERAERARPHYRKVHVGGFDDVDLGDTHYDVILFLDVLEHVAEPQDAMAWAADQLAPGGAVLTLIPNTAFWRARVKIAKGDWSYEDAGLFDRDHLRFFDLSTMESVGEDTGLVEVGRQLFPGSFPRWWRFDRDRSLQRWPNLFAHHALLEWRLEPVTGPQEMRGPHRPAGML